MGNVVLVLKKSASETKRLDFGPQCSYHQKAQNSLSYFDIARCANVETDIARISRILDTPTPSGNTILFPKNVTEEQELYAKGFEVALKNMHQGTGSAPGGATISTSTGLTISTQPPPPPLVQYKTEPSNSSNASAIEAIERATAAHRAKLATEVSPRPSSSASGSMDSTDQIRIKEEIDDSDEDD